MPENFQRAWPAKRCYHSATHLCFSKNHQLLLVIGGSSGREILSDVWLLDLNTWMWTEVRYWN